MAEQLARFKNISPLGKLDVPDLGRVIDAGDEFEVRAELAPMFAAQPDNYEAVNKAAKDTKPPVAEVPDEPEEEAGEPSETGEPSGTNVTTNGATE